MQCPIKACWVDIVSCSLGDLEMGADEYVTLPFSPRVLVERLRALMRRASRSPKNLHVFEAGCS